MKEFEQPEIFNRFANLARSCRLRTFFQQCQPEATTRLRFVIRRLIEKAIQQDASLCRKMRLHSLDELRLVKIESLDDQPAQAVVRGNCNLLPNQKIDHSIEHEPG